MVEQNLPELKELKSSINRNFRVNRAAARVWLGLAMYKLPEISFILDGCKIIIMEIGTKPYQPINPASV